MQSQGPKLGLLEFPLCQPDEKPVPPSQRAGASFYPLPLAQQKPEPAGVEVSQLQDSSVSPEAKPQIPPNE